MSWPDVRELVALGMEVGAHTVSHPVLATLGAERQRVEIADSLVRLRTQLGVPIDTFAYPVGSRRAYDSSTMELLADLGVRRAFNFCGGTNSVRGRGPRNPYDISRAGVFGADTPDIVRAMSALPVIFARSSRYA
jgi:peptidoglycan/xylan/chitin deacetylase (PgdA/CDA1 family)